MKLAAIYNVFDGVEWIEKSIESIKDYVDSVIIVNQEVSNYGESYNNYGAIYRVLESQNLKNYHLIQYTPNLRDVPMVNETNKRQEGINMALYHGCTHFLHIDCDEVYPDFEKLLNEYISLGCDGSVCEMYTYFKIPFLRLENPDNYYVPFIHKLTPNTVCGLSVNYPFYVDPTRKISNCDSVQLLSSGKMHHYSWVRDDIMLKIRNSTARINIEKSQLLQDYLNPDVGEGYFLKDYGQKLIKV